MTLVTLGNTGKLTCAHTHGYQEPLTPAIKHIFLPKRIHHNGAMMIR